MQYLGRQRMFKQVVHIVSMVQVHWVNRLQNTCRRLSGLMCKITRVVLVFLEVLGRVPAIWWGGKTERVCNLEPIPVKIAIWGPQNASAVSVLLVRALQGKQNSFFLCQIRISRCWTGFLLQHLPNRWQETQTDNLRPKINKMAFKNWVPTS
jgi:hypothetical protein